MGMVMVSGVEVFRRQMLYKCYSKLYYQTRKHRIDFYHNNTSMMIIKQTQFNCQRFIVSFIPYYEISLIVVEMFRIPSLILKSFSDLLHFAMFSRDLDNLSKAPSTPQLLSFLFV